MTSILKHLRAILEINLFYLLPRNTCIFRDITYNYSGFTPFRISTYYVLPGKSCIVQVTLNKKIHTIFKLFNNV